jgi:hypothetical protein
MLQSLKVLVENKVRTIFENYLPSLPVIFSTNDSKIDEANNQQQALQRCFYTMENGGVLTETSPSKTVAQTFDANGFYQWMQGLDVQVSPQLTFPEKNPLTGQTIDWAQEICQSNLDSLNRQSLRDAKEQTLSENEKINHLSHLLLAALKSGNISLAMMIFSQMEARSANAVTSCLMEKVRKLQDHKRDLSLQIQQQKDDAEGSKNIQKIKTDMETANDDISVLQTFIRDVAQDKQYSLEMANGFLTREYETTMSIVRSFGR